MSRWHKLIYINSFLWRLVCREYAAIFSSRHPWLTGRRGEDWVGDITLGHILVSHPEDWATGGGGGYQQCGTQHSNRRLPETAGGKGRVIQGEKKGGWSKGEIK